MKKKLFIWGLSCCCSTGLLAQNKAEWLRQKRTQMAYLSEQLLASKSYLKDLRSGYQWCQSGLQLIAANKQGEGHLHRLFYRAHRRGSLPGIPSSYVQRYGKLQAALRSRIEALRRRSQQPLLLSEQERTYFHNVATRLLELLVLDATNFSELADPEIALRNDQQRLSKMEAILESLQAKLGFAGRSYAELSVLLAQRQSEAKHIRAMRARYGLERREP